MSASGRKAPPGRYLGPLKWGVGKLIADCEVTPVVVPFYHRGMEEIYPLDENNNNKYMLPKFGKTVYLLVGDAVPVKDIVDEYKTLMDNEPDEDRKEVLQYAMYKALTDRIDKALADLEVELLEIARKDGYTEDKTLLKDVPDSAGAAASRNEPTIYQVSENKPETKNA